MIFNGFLKFWISYFLKFTVTKSVLVYSRFLDNLTFFRHFNFDQLILWSTTSKFAAKLVSSITFFNQLTAKVFVWNKHKRVSIIRFISTPLPLTVHFFPWFTMENNFSSTAVYFSIFAFPSSRKNHKFKSSIWTWL